MASGLLTGVAAGTATAGHLFALRWAPAASMQVQSCVITRLRAAWVTVAGFTAAQEIGMDLVIARAFTASYTGGTAATLTGDNNNKRTAFPASSMTDLRIGTTGALVAVTQTLDAQAIGRDGYSELAAAATVPTGRMVMQLDTTDNDRYPVVLAPNEGLVIRNLVAMGAGGTARLIVDVDWLEVERY